MRALVVSAFALTLFVSAITVYFALSSHSLDGEPYAVITIDPPAQTVKTVSVKKSEPVENNVPEPTVVTTATAVPAPTTEPVATEAPKLAPAAETDNSESAADASSEDAATTQAAARRTSEVARPVSTTPNITDDPFFSSAEPGIGLGVGNLGPLEPVNSN